MALRAGVMESSKKSGLKVSQKLELILALFSRKSIRPVLDSLTVQQLVEAHSFVWDKLVEVHYLIRNRDFSREVITKQMVPSAEYQRQQGCDLRLDYCKGVECIWSNPGCAGNKVKNNMEVMAVTINGYIADCASKQRNGIEDNKEIKAWH